VPVNSVGVLDSYPGCVSDAAPVPRLRREPLSATFPEAWCLIMACMAVVLFMRVAVPQPDCGEHSTGRHSPPGRSAGKFGDRGPPERRGGDILERAMSAEIRPDVAFLSGLFPGILGEMDPVAGGDFLAPYL
jgi:hypothetical protein